MICAVEGCEVSQRYLTRGWCAKHYRRWLAHGDPLGGARFRGYGCQAEGCSAQANRNGYCQFHWRRWMRFGDPLAGGPPRPQSGPRTDEVTYRNAHLRLTTWRGAPSLCDECGRTDPDVIYEWAYRHDAEEALVDDFGLVYSTLLTDYIRLCRPCHRYQEERVQHGGSAMKLSKEDVVWAGLVKEREEWTCQRCGTSHVPGSRALNAHHIFTRSRKSTRHMLLNGVALCVGCHRWAHANPLEFHDLARSWLGAGYDELRSLSVTLRKRQPA